MPSLPITLGVFLMVTVSNLALQKKLKHARHIFLDRAREIIPVTVAQEHDANMLTWRFWRWASTIDHTQAEDPTLLAAAARLRRLRYWERAHMTAVLLLSMAFLYWLIRL